MWSGICSVCALRYYFGPCHLHQRKLTLQGQEQGTAEGTDERIYKRQEDKQQRQIQSKRREVEKMLRTGNLESVLKDFPEVNEASVAQLKEILNGNAVGKKILHVWYEEGKLITYNGKLKLKRPHTYKVSYWELNQPEDDAAD